MEWKPKTKWKIKIFTEQLYTAVDKDLEFYNKIFLQSTTGVQDNILIIDWIDKWKANYIFILAWSYHINFQSESKLLLILWTLMKKVRNKMRFSEKLAVLSSNVYTDLVDKLVSKWPSINEFFNVQRISKTRFYNWYFNYIENGYINYYDPNIFDSTDLNKIIPLTKNHTLIKILNSIKTKKHISKTIIFNAIKSCKSIKKLLFK